MPPAAPDGYFFSPRGSLYSISPDSSPNSSPSRSASQSPSPFGGPSAERLGTGRTATAAPSSSQRALDYYGVLDFECTCDADGPGGGNGMPHEIIEWPVVLVEAATNTVVSEFHAYVRPTEQPQLSRFCSQLTGITQEQVNGGTPLSEVLLEFDDWLNRLDIGPGRARSMALVTDGPWDFINFLLPECQRKGLPYPECGRSWVDLRKAYSDCTNYPPMSINSMLQTAGLQFEGRLHSGIDDTRNIARILQVLLRRGHTIAPNASIDTTTAHLPWAQRQPQGGRGSSGGRGGGRRGRRGRRAFNSRNEALSLTIDPPEHVIGGGWSDSSTDLETAGKTPRSAKRSSGLNNEALPTQQAPNGFFFSPHGTLYGISPDTTPESTPDSSPAGSPPTNSGSRSSTRAADVRLRGGISSAAHGGPSPLLREMLSPRFGSFPNGSPRSDSSAGSGDPDDSASYNPSSNPENRNSLMDRDSPEYKAARKAAKKERLRLKREEQKAAAEQERRLLQQTRTEEQELAEHLCETGDIEAAVKAYRRALAAWEQLDVLDGVVLEPLLVPGSLSVREPTARELLEQKLEAALKLRRQHRQAARAVARSSARHEKMPGPQSPPSSLPPAAGQSAQSHAEMADAPGDTIEKSAIVSEEECQASVERVKYAHSDTKHRPLPIKLEGMEEPIAFDRSQVALSARTADEDFPPPTPRTIAAWKNAAVERAAMEDARRRRTVSDEQTALISKELEQVNEQISACLVAQAVQSPRMAM